MESWQKGHNFGSTNNTAIKYMEMESCSEYLTECHKIWKCDNLSKNSDGKFIKLLRDVGGFGNRIIQKHPRASNQMQNKNWNLFSKPVSEDWDDTFPLCSA